MSQMWRVLFYVYYIVNSARSECFDDDITHVPRKNIALKKCVTSSSQFSESAPYSITFEETGCPNHFYLSNWPNYQDLGLGDMLAYCSKTKSGEATELQRNRCCGGFDGGFCVPESCTQQLQLASLTSPKGLVDGSLSSLFMTDYYDVASPRWIEIDLGTEFSIKHFIIYHRETNIEYLNGADIVFKSDNGSIITIEKITTSLSEYNITLDTAINARFFRIENNDHIQLREIAIYEEIPEDGYCTDSFDDRCEIRSGVCISDAVISPCEKCVSGNILNINGECSYSSLYDCTTSSFEVDTNDNAISQAICPNDTVLIKSTSLKTNIIDCCNITLDNSEIAIRDENSCFWSTSVSKAQQTVVDLKNRQYLASGIRCTGVECESREIYQCKYQGVVLDINENVTFVETPDSSGYTVCPREWENDNVLTSLRSYQFRVNSSDDSAEFHGSCHVVLDTTKHDPWHCLDVICPDDDMWIDYNCPGSDCVNITTNACLSGEYTDHVCWNCEEGFYSDAAGVCSPCTVEQSCLVADRTCRNDGSNFLTCLTCKELYFTEANGECVLCEGNPENCAKNSNICLNREKLECQTCQDLYFAENGVCMAQNCENHSNDLDELFCTRFHPSDCVANKNIKYCETCVPGAYEVNPGECAPCPVSQFCSTYDEDLCNFDQEKYCLSAIDAFYVESGKALPCRRDSNCLETSNSTCNSKNELYCLDTEGGFYLSDGLVFPCISDENCLTLNTTSCNSQNSLICQECKKGYYLSPTGTCIQCVKGSDCLVPGDECRTDELLLTCIDCEANFFTEGNGDCTLCTESPENCVKSSNVCLNQTTLACDSCAPLFVQSNGICLEQNCERNDDLPEDLFCKELHSQDCAPNTNFSYCNECMDGAYSVSPGICHSCSQSQFCDIRNDTNCNFENEKYCLEAVPGFYVEFGKALPCREDINCAVMSNNTCNSKNELECVTPKDGFYVFQSLTFPCTKNENCKVKNETSCNTKNEYVCMVCNDGFITSDELSCISDLRADEGAFELKYIGVIVAVCVLVVICLTIGIIAYRKRMQRKIKKIENKGLGGMTAEEFVMNEFSPELASPDLFTDEEYDAVTTPSSFNSKTFSAEYDDCDRGYEPCHTQTTRNDVQHSEGYLQTGEQLSYLMIMTMATPSGTAKGVGPLVADSSENYTTVDHK